MKNKMTSKIIVMVSVMGMLMACGGKTEEKEVIVVPAAPVVVVPAPAPADKATPTNSTKITLDKNGVKLEGEKVEVNVNK